MQKVSGSFVHIELPKKEDPLTYRYQDCKTGPWNLTIFDPSRPNQSRFQVAFELGYDLKPIILTILR